MRDKVGYILNLDERNISNSALLAYLEGALTPEEVGKIEVRLSEDAALRAELEALRNRERALFALGVELRELSPVVSVVDGVLKGAVEVRAAAALDNELAALGADLRGQAPRIDIAASVMHRLSATAPNLDAKLLEAELYAVGEEIRLLAPRVSLGEAIAAAASDKIVPLSSRVATKSVKRREPLFSWRIVVAAAACAVFGLAFVMTHLVQPDMAGRRDMARNAEPFSESDAANNESPASESPSQDDSLAFQSAPPTEALALLSTIIRPSAGEEPETDNQETAVQAECTVNDIIAARRNAIGGDADALLMLARWGALDPDEARRLLASGALSPAAVAGLARFLPEDEAQALLQQAVEQHPEDSYLRYLLAKQLVNSSDQQANAQEQLAAFKELAPSNSLPYYMDAQLRLAQGDVAGALQAIEYAASFAQGDAYALRNAQNHSAALQAAGYPFETAQMLAAFNAGADEYSAVSQLSYDLLSYGAYFESLGDYETAMDIYKGVQRMGFQITQGANYSNEQLAGLDAQSAALDAIGALADLMQIPGGVRTVENAYTLLMEGLNIFMDNTALLDGLLGSADSAAIAAAIDQFIQNGDMRSLTKVIR